MIRDAGEDGFTRCSVGRSDIVQDARPCRYDMVGHPYMLEKPERISI